MGELPADDGYIHSPCLRAICTAITTTTNARHMRKVRLTLFQFTAS